MFTELDASCAPFIVALKALAPVIRAVSLMLGADVHEGYCSLFVCLCVCLWPI